MDQENIHLTNSYIKKNNEIIESYLKETDWRVRENSNTGYSIQGLNNHLMQTSIALYWLNSIYDKEISDLHTKAYFHIHDLGYLTAYCCGWDLRDLLIKGFGGVEGKIKSKPPKHLRSALGQIWNFLYSLQGEAAGAQAFSNFDTYLAPFVELDGLTYEEVKKEIEEFIYNMNIPTRAGFQTPFTNITLDIKVPEYMKDEPIIIGGEYHSKYTYGMFQKGMYMINRAFAEVMMEGDANHRIFTFPIPTYNIDKNFPWDDPELDPIWEMTAKFGIPYFANYVNSDMNPEDARSMCIHKTEKIKVLFNEKVHYIEIQELEKLLKLKFDEEGWSDVNQDIKIESVNPDTLEKEWINIKRVLKVESEKYVSIQTKGYTLRCTKDHPVAQLIDNKLVHKQAKDLSLSDHLVIYNDDGTLSKDSIISITIAPCVGKKDIYYDVELEKNHYFIHSYRIVSNNCCRLRIDNRELRKRGGGLFGSNPLTGSIGVVTINLPRIGYLANSKKEFYERLEYLMIKAKESLIVKRKKIEEFTEMGLYPYSRIYLEDIKKKTGSYWSNHFNTIGIVGMNECIRNLTSDRYDITTEKGQKMSKSILDFMREKLIEFQKETGLLFNLEATPAEGTAYRLAKHDKEKYKNILTAGTDDSPYYTNSSQLPVGFTNDVFEALQLQDELQCKYTGGTVLHLFLGERIEASMAKKLVKKVTDNFSLPYISITPTFTICPVHGYIPGEHYRCPYHD